METINTISDNTTSFALIIPECEIQSFKCPISLDLMEDPVTLNDGHSYDRKSIQEHLIHSQNSPMTNEPLENECIINNYNLKSLINEWKNKNSDKKEIILRNNLIVFKDDYKNVTSEKVELYTKNFQYHGSVKDGLKNGKGIIYFKNGEKYDGNWFNNEKHGKGKYFYEDKSNYSGDWKNDKYNDIGMFTNDVNIKFYCKWLEGKKDGKGYIILNNDNYKNSIIECNWNSDLISNSGIIIYEDGSKYIGEIKDYKRNGKGELYFTDSTIHKCNWLNDNVDGLINVYYKNGNSYEGIKSDNIQYKNCQYFINFQMENILSKLHPEIQITTMSTKNIVNLKLENDTKVFINNLFNQILLKIINCIILSLIEFEYDDNYDEEYDEIDSSDDEDTSDIQYIITYKSLNKKIFFNVLDKLLTGNLLIYCKKEINDVLYKNNDLGSRFNSKDLELEIKIKSVYKFLKKILNNIFNNLKINYDVNVCLSTFLEILIDEVLEGSGFLALDNFIKSDNKQSIDIKISLDDVKSTIRNNNDLFKFINDKLDIEV